MAKAKQGGHLPYRDVPPRLMEHDSPEPTHSRDP